MTGQLLHQLWALNSISRPILREARLDHDVHESHLWSHVFPCIVCLPNIQLSCKHGIIQCERHSGLFIRRRFFLVECRAVHVDWEKAVDDINLLNENEMRYKRPHEFSPNIGCRAMKLESPICAWVTTKKLGNTVGNKRMRVSFMCGEYDGSSFMIPLYSCIHHEVRIVNPWQWSWQRKQRA